MENFRPQEVQEKVTYAEPLSPPNEQEACAPLREEGGEGGEDVEHSGVSCQSSGGVEPSTGSRPSVMK